MDCEPWLSWAEVSSGTSDDGGNCKGHTECGPVCFDMAELSQAMATQLNALTMRIAALEDNNSGEH